MNRSAITPPSVDPTPIFELFRGSYGSELLTAAIAHFQVFGRLSQERLTFEQLRQALLLDERPANVMVTALRAMGMVELSSDGHLSLTPLAQEHLVPGGDFDVGNYVGLAAQSPGVLTMVELLRSNRPLNFDSSDGAAFIYRDGMASAMDSAESARHFTMALAGRAKNVSPALAEALPTGDAKLITDVGAGTGIYTYALLQKNPNLKAVIVDRPEVLRVAAEMADEYGVADRTEMLAGDMFEIELPRDSDITLLSNILHDWNVPECQTLVQRCAESLSVGGRLAIHDVFLNDNLDGPLPIALYSAALFTLTEGRAYSEREYRSWLELAGLVTSPRVDTLVHCGVVVGTR